MVAPFYATLEPIVRNGHVIGARFLRATKTPPALGAGNIAVLVELTVPAQAFDPLSVALVVEPSRTVLAAEHAMPPEVLA